MESMAVPTEVYGSLWQSRRVFVESMAVPTGSVRQSKEVYGVYNSLCKYMSSISPSRQSRAS